VNGALGTLLALLLLAAVGPPPRSAPPLRLLAVSPEPGGGEVHPDQAFRLVFDRPLGLQSFSPGAVRLSYVDSPYTFVVDPFLYTAYRAAPGEGMAVMIVDPPELIPGQSMLIELTDQLRGADGSTLEAAATGSTGGVRRRLAYRVLALPPAPAP
jgi:hypothetical protein